MKIYDDDVGFSSGQTMARFFSGLSVISRLLGAAARVAPAHLAKTAEERAAIWRMRYRIYVEEQSDLRIPGTDHVRRELRQPDDEAPGTLLFYTGTPPNITATVTVHVLDPGRLPAGFHRDYSLDRFSGLDRRPMAHVGFLMANPTLRGTAEVIAMTASAVAKTVEEHQVELMFSICSPGLLRNYQRFGLRPYGAAVVSTYRGMQIPVAGITADLAHLRRCASPWYPTLARLGATGRLPQRDFSSLLPAFERSGVEIVSTRVRTQVEAAMARHRIPFLADLPEGTRRRLLSGGCIFEVAANVDMLTEGIVNRDIFVVLEGKIDVHRSASRLGTFDSGAVLGELAFFSASGQRSASVRSLETSQVLHLSHGFLRRLAAKHPADGVAVYQALGRVLAHRLGISADSPRKDRNLSAEGAAVYE